MSYCLPVRLSVMVSVSAVPPGSGWSILVGSVAGVFIVITTRFATFVRGCGRHAIAAVDPFRQILKDTALAAEWLPRRVRELAAAKDTKARSHAHILWYCAQRF